MVKKRRCFLLLLLLFAVSPVASNAAFTTFLVDLSGFDTSGATPHRLRVFGSITLDPDFPVGMAIQSSSLLFQHEPTVPFTNNIPLRNQPFVTGNGDGLNWSVQDGSLYINRTGTGSGSLVWQTDDPGTGLVDGFLQFASVGPHTIETLANGAFGDEDLVVLKASGAPDGPTGFLVGTAMVPEPSSAMFFAGLGAMFTVRRRRRVS
tara:strand:- start:9516 stop:10133 length:618 start_codon:yes stop_codon:yes gene_type:complete